MHRRLTQVLSIVPNRNIIFKNQYLAPQRTPNITVKPYGFGKSSGKVSVALIALVPLN